MDGCVRQSTEKKVSLSYASVGRKGHTKKTRFPLPIGFVDRRKPSLAPGNLTIEDKVGEIVTLLANEYCR